MAEIVDQAEAEMTFEQIIRDMAARIQKLEAAVGYIIHIQKIAPPTVIENEARDD